MIQEVEARPASQAAPSIQSQAAPRAEYHSSRSFSEIVSNYWSDKNRGSALEFLKNLNPSELRTIGLEHGFSNPELDLYGLSFEKSHSSESAARYAGTN